ncbi:BTAD domain-containing putative transcriptional regulator [Streptomyces sp. NPDC005407]|uniref:BTAD domain-containing putative transcriptional regulator n=1 Tax=Streptomyces sp. NPDC005407 TaxID=3155340 RepID=UPI0033A87084
MGEIMLFSLLGPLEALAAGAPIALGGTKQRATLGYLLLHANRVVATSELLQALWDADDAPPTARKILQNAVWGLRGVLYTAHSPHGSTQDSAHHSAGPPSPGAPELLTQAPGYLLKVDPSQVDLFVFQERVASGRAAMAGGEPQTAAALLREALDLWRGPVLADLAETGIAWPELIAAQKSQLDAMDDLFDAELACGRHHAILGQLEVLVESQPLRERSCEQLMLALYRCGRQAEALNVYDRARSELVESLGLEPGRGLRTLQHAILTHEPSLTVATEAVELVVAGPVGGPVPSSPALAPAPAAPPPAPAPAAAAARAPVRSSVPSSDPAPRTGVPGHTPAPGKPARHRRSASVTERIQLNALLVSARLEADDTACPGAVDTALDRVGASIREVIERFGGTLVASIGSVSLALFGIHGPSDNDSEQAVHAALAIREGFAAEDGTAVSAAVTTGRALIRRHPYHDAGSPPSVAGVLLDEGQALLSRVPSGQVWVSGATRRAAASVVDFSRVDEAGDIWQVCGAYREYATAYSSKDPYPGAHAGPVVDRDHELGVLSGLLEWSRHRAMSHLVTVLGKPGSGKTRLLMEFERWAAAESAGAPARFVIACPPPRGSGAGTGRGPWAVAAQILAAYSGIRPYDSESAARGKLAAVVRAQQPDRAREERLYERLLPLLLLPPREGEAARTADLRDALAAWREFLVTAARTEPLVVIVDDAHQADDALLDCVESLVEDDPDESVSLLVVVAARPELLERQPGWGGGKHRASTITLTPVDGFGWAGGPGAGRPPAGARARIPA